MVKRITNQNPLIEEKVNYFLDRITHAADYAGREYHLELESPTSLLEKILFRFQNDKVYRLPYFDNYFKQSFFTADTFWNAFPTYLRVKGIVANYNQLGKSKNEEKKRILMSTAFQNDLHILHQDLVAGMPRELMTGVIGNVLCSHKLDEFVPNSTTTHADFFITAAILLVAEYLFRGYSKGEVKDIISRVFSKDIHSFPFPANATTKRLREKYLAEKTLQNQLNGFTNAFTPVEQSGIIMVKVYGGNFPENFEFKYDQVSFYGKDHNRIKKIRLCMNQDDDKSFFVDGDYFIASVKIQWYSEYSLLPNLIKKIRKELPFISASYDRDFSVDTSGNYIRLTNAHRYFGTAWSTKTFENSTHQITLKELNDNAFHILRKTSGISVDWFLKCESIFIQAQKNKSVADYWTYIETLLSFNRSEKQVMGLVSSIILENEKFNRDQRILTTLSNNFSFFSNGYDLLNVPQERYRNIMRAMRKGKVAKEIKAVTYPFLRDLVNEYHQTLDQAYYIKSKEYYYGILVEAYEYRNFLLHSGFENEAAKQKMITSLPRIVFRMRWLILNALKKGENNTPFDQLIEKLVEKGNSHLPISI